MNPIEIEAQGAILLNQAEVKAAEIGEILAQLNACAVLSNGLERIGGFEAILPNDIEHLRLTVSQ